MGHGGAQAQSEGGVTRAKLPFVPAKAGTQISRFPLCTGMSGDVGKEGNSWGSWRQLVGKIFPAWINTNPLSG